MAILSSNIPKELEKAAKTKKLKVGTNSVIRALKQGLAETVIYANDTPKNIKDDIVYYSKLADVHAVQFEGNSKDLGVRCKRTHGVLAAVILRA
jgi:large subunit ribosomal protein L30e